jgi:hypothetical protein
MANLSQRTKFEPCRTLGFAAIGAGYVGVGTSIDHPARQIFIQNLTDTTLMFSFDGVDDHFPLPANGFFLDDITTNRTNQSGEYCISVGDRLYVRELIGVLPTNGAVYFTVIYAD